jgi:hypothetical protein
LQINLHREISPDQHPIPATIDSKKVSSRWLDRAFLLGTALFVCVTSVASFWFSADHHINPAWVFVAWNSILMVPLFIRDFRSHLSKVSFVVYLLAWALIHGLLVAALKLWLPLPAILPFMAIELIAGFMGADYFFNARPTDKEGS